MALQVDIQNEGNLSGVPPASDFRRWVEAALIQDYTDFEQTIRVVGEPESKLLNEQFRGRDAPTNVLSFPSQSGYLDYQCLGDLVICAPLVARESVEQNKSEIAHWAHLVVHGMLHLQGFDHENDVDATEMENLEVEILSTLGYSNPYNVA